MRELVYVIDTDLFPLRFCLDEIGEIVVQVKNQEDAEERGEAEEERLQKIS